MTVQGHSYDDNVGAPVNRNRIINGAFDVWQRGTSFSPTNNTYSSDRWVILFDGTGATRTISQQTFTPGNVIPKYEPTYHVRFAQSVAGSAGTYNLFSQHIENVRTFAGQTVTVSFYAKADAARNVTLKYSQLFGTGGSSAIYDVALGSSNTVSLTTSWQRYTITGTINSISGKTVSVNADSSLRIDFNMPLNSTFTIDLWGVQLEAGPIATPFEFEPFETTLRKCQRYFVKSYNNDVTPGTITSVGEIRYVAASTAGEAAPVVHYTVEMRGTPSAYTLYNAITGTSGQRRNYSSSTNETSTGFNIGGANSHAGNNVGHTSGALYGYHFTATAEL